MALKDKEHAPFFWGFRLLVAGFPSFHGGYSHRALYSVTKWMSIFYLKDMLFIPLFMYTIPSIGTGLKHSESFVVTNHRLLQLPTVVTHITLDDDNL